jgi:hypothetical protein
MAAAGGPAYTALLPVAADYEEAAAEVEALPPEFWEPRQMTATVERWSGI